jgi:hypothetical protein
MLSAVLTLLQLRLIVDMAGVYQPHGLLPSMVRKSVATLTGALDNPVLNLVFIEEILSFLTVLIISPGGVNAVDSAGIIASLIPMLRYQSSDINQVKVVAMCVRILDSLVHNNSNLNGFRDLGGLDDLVERIKVPYSSFVCLTTVDNTHRQRLPYSKDSLGMRKKGRNLVLKCLLGKAWSRVGWTGLLRP